MGKIRILNSSGDTALLVDEPATESGDRVVSKEEAERVVAEHVRNGGLAYAKREGGAEQVKSYDPSEQEVVLAPRMQGG